MIKIIAYYSANWTGKRHIYEYCARSRINRKYMKCEQQRLDERRVVFKDLPPLSTCNLCQDNTISV